MNIKKILEVQYMMIKRTMTKYIHNNYEHMIVFKYSDNNPKILQNTNFIMKLFTEDNNVYR